MSHTDPADMIQNAWPHDGQAALLVKAAVSPASTGSYPAFSGVRTLSALAPDSAAVRLFERAVKINLAGLSTITVPNAATWPVGSFIAEGQPSSVAQFTTAAVTVGPARKILIMAAVSGELANVTADSAQTIIANVLAVAVSRTLDTALFSNVAGDASRPPGLLYNVTPITAASGGGLTALAADLGNLVGAISDAGIDGDDVIFLSHPETVAKLRLQASSAFSNSVFGTPQIAVGTVIAVAPGGLMTGYSGEPEIETSTEATVHFEDTNPLPISSGGVVASPTSAD